MGEAVLPDSFDISPPRPDTRMESRQATGCSLPDAVSDLIENSINAGARSVWPNFHWAGESSWASIHDDGCGRWETRLLDAMRVGSGGPVEAREPSDPGRYGFGVINGLNGLLKKPVGGAEVVQGQGWISAKVQQRLSGVGREDKEGLLEARRSPRIGGTECSRWERGTQVDLFRDPASALP